MTHTEESLMALADKYGCETATDYNSRKASEAFADLRLAIREVLAERDDAWETIEQLKLAHSATGQRAEKAEAERDESAWASAERREQLERAEAEVARMKRVDDEATRLAIQVSDLKAECERNRKDAERGRFMLKHGEWRRNSEYTTTHLAVAVPFNSDLSCYATREAAIDAAMQEKL